MCNNSQDFNAPVYKVIAQGKNCVVTANNIHVANRVLFKLFSEVIFPTSQQRHILFHSYKANIVDLILYAKENGLSPYQYIKSIKQELLRIPHVRAR